MRKIFQLLACLVAAPMALAAQRDVTLRFEMSFAGVQIGEVVDVVKFSEDRFSIESTGEPVGVVKYLGIPGINRFSAGKVGEDGILLMEEFGEERGEKAREVKVDLASGEVSWESDKGLSGSGASDGAPVYNSLTVVYSPYSIGSLPADGAGFMATGRRFYAFEYSTQKQESKLEVGAGEFEVWHQQRLNDPKGRQISAWYAPELGNLPVKISISGRSGTIVMELLETDFAATN